MLWIMLGRVAERLGAITAGFAAALTPIAERLSTTGVQFSEALVKLCIRLPVIGAGWYGLLAQEWVPDLVKGVLVVPLFGGILLCGGPVASYESTRFTKVVDRSGTTLMTISASYSAGTLIGLAILNGNDPTPCSGRWICSAVMWWAIVTGAITVLAGIWGMTRSNNEPWGPWAREQAARLVVGTTVVATVLIVVFALVFSGAI